MENKSEIPEEYQYLLDIEITEEDLGLTTPDSQ